MIDATSLCAWNASLLSLLSANFHCLKQLADSGDESVFSIDIAIFCESTAFDTGTARTVEVRAR